MRSRRTSAIEPAVIMLVSDWKTGAGYFAGKNPSLNVAAGLVARRYKYAGWRGGLTVGFPGDRRAAPGLLLAFLAVSLTRRRAVRKSRFFSSTESFCASRCAARSDCN